MYAAQIAQYMRRLVDDPGIVRLPNSLLATMLEIAYEEFRNMAPWEVWERYYAPPLLVGQYNVDLTGILFTGAPPLNLPPSEALASRLTRVVLVDPVSGGILGTFQPATSWETLGQIPNASAAMLSNYAWTGQRYWLDGKILRFSVPVSGQIQIWYLPTQTVNWLSAITSTTAVHVDDLTQFHDIIALLAAEQYYIQQAQPNPSLEIQLRRRTDKMMEFFAQARSGKASRYVNEEYQR
jgi:hypothetical protein